MISSAIIAEASREAAEALQHFQLPFGRQAWLGQQGNWLGSGLGSSIDFQDHRAYMPGDDPRYIHWAAYARTGQLTMKLYRAEVAPLVDIMVDVSTSMFENPLKARRTAALLDFCVASAATAAAPVRIHLARGRKLRDVPADLIRAQNWLSLVPEDYQGGHAPGPLPWRPAAMKILISDLLFPEAPESLLLPMSSGSGLCLIFRPWVAEELDFEIRGNIELIDVETGTKRNQRIDESIAERYRKAYARHIELWETASKRRGVLCCALPCVNSLKDAFAKEPTTLGAVAVH